THNPKTNSGRGSIGSSGNGRMVSTTCSIGMPQMCSARRHKSKHCNPSCFAIAPSARILFAYPGIDRSERKYSIFTLKTRLLDRKSAHGHALSAPRAVLAELRESRLSCLGAMSGLALDRPKIL